MTCDFLDAHLGNGTAAWSILGTVLADASGSTFVRRGTGIRTGRAGPGVGSREKRATKTRELRVPYLS